MGEGWGCRKIKSSRYFESETKSLRERYTDRGRGVGWERGGGCRKIKSSRYFESETKSLRERYTDRGRHVQTKMRTRGL